MQNRTLSEQAIKDGIGYLYSLFQDIGTKLVVSLVIVLIGLIIGRLAGKAVQKLLHELGLDQNLKKSTGIRVSVESWIGNALSYLIYGIAVIIALYQLNLATAVLNIISAALIVLVILSLFLSVKDYIPNFFAGIFLMNKGIIKSGDHVKVAGTEGKVIYTDLIETRIETSDHDIVYIPNSIFVKSKFIKVGKSTQSSLKG